MEGREDPRVFAAQLSGANKVSAVSQMQDSSWVGGGHSPWKVISLQSQQSGSEAHSEEVSIFPGTKVWKKRAQGSLEAGSAWSRYHSLTDWA